MCTQKKYATNSAASPSAGIRPVRNIFDAISDLGVRRRDSVTDKRSKPTLNKPNSRLISIRRHGSNRA
jgi:hypothetical protein